MSFSLSAMLRSLIPVPASVYNALSATPFRAARTALLATACNAMLISSANCQLLQTWDTKSRERSQRLTSAAVTALDKGQTAQAVALLNQATLVDPKDAVALNTLGMALAKQGKYDEALDALNKAYKISHFPETLLNTGIVYYLQHDYEAAISSWSKAIEGDKKLYAIYGGIGFAHMRKGEFDNAEQAFRKLITAKPNSELAYRGLALSSYLSGQVNAAIKAAEHARSLSSNSPPILLLLAKLQLIQGNSEAGKQLIKEWQAASTKKKSTPFSMTVFGVPVQHDFHWDAFSADHFDNGNFLLARTRLLPKEDGARRSYSAKGKIGLVLPQARAAAESAPQDYFILRELALLELANGEYTSAATHFSKVLELCPGCRIDWLHLARAQSLAGKPSEASYAVKEFKRQLPDEKISSVFTEFANSNNTESAEPLHMPEQGRPPEPVGSGF